MIIREDMTHTNHLKNVHYTLFVKLAHDVTDLEKKYSSICYRIFIIPALDPVMQNWLKININQYVHTISQNVL